MFRDESHCQEAGRFPQYNELVDFFTNPAITPDAARFGLNPHRGATVICVVEIQGLEFHISRAGGVLVDPITNGKVGSIGRLQTLWVDPEYRGRGLGRDMIVQWFMKNPWWRPGGKSLRTAMGKNTYIRAWDEIRPAIEIKAKED